MRVVATERMCWHCADEEAARPLPSSGSMTTSVLLCRMVRVNGTTWTTFRRPLRTRRAVTTTAGRRSPASLPAGIPRSSSTTSPGVSIQPRGLAVGELRRKLSRHDVLPESLDRSAHGLVDRLVAFGRQSGHSRMRVPTDPDRRRLGHGFTVRRRRLDRLQPPEPTLPRNTRLAKAPDTGLSAPRRRAGRRRRRCSARGDRRRRSAGAQCTRERPRSRPPR